MFARFDFPVLPSTSGYIRDNLDSLPGNSAVFAGVQTLAKGRNGKSWLSPEGQLCASFLLRGVETKGFPLVAAVLLIRALVLCGVSAKIKWPNDIVAELGGEHKKICGILCEQIKDSLIVGVGLNVSVPESYFTANSLPHAASLSMLPEYDGSSIEKVKNYVTENFEDYADIYAGCSACFMDFYEEYKKLCLNLGRVVKLIKNGIEMNALVLDIAKDGVLVCKDEFEQIFSVTSGEVSVRGIYGYA